VVTKAGAKSKGGEKWGEIFLLKSKPFRERKKVAKDFFPYIYI
jgi:hypothetical protein